MDYDTLLIFQQINEKGLDTMKTPASILLVDDQPDLLSNLSLALEAAGYQTLTASDGVEALAALQAQPVDLILSDIEMPRMNGYQLYQWVRENPQWGTIPFLFLTAHIPDGDIRLGQELSGHDYLTKPIRTGDLLSVIQHKLECSIHSCHQGTCSS